MSQWPVGSKWKAENERVALLIWLESRNNIEIWYWEYLYPDGSCKRDGGSDWGTSYRMCREECGYMLCVDGKIPRFKRI